MTRLPEFIGEDLKGTRTYRCPECHRTLEVKDRERIITAISEHNRKYHPADDERRCR